VFLFFFLGLKKKTYEKNVLLLILVSAFTVQVGKSACVTTNCLADNGYCSHIYVPDLGLDQYNCYPLSPKHGEGWANCNTGSSHPESIN
jgi:hypothetical protein